MNGLPTVYSFQTGSKVRVKSGDFLLIKIECTKFPPANHYDLVPNSHSKIIVSLKLIEVIRWVIRSLRF